MLKQMLAELDGHRLEVLKVPGRHGGYVRCPMTVNCEWYQRLCRSHLSSRRHYPKLRTIIRRQATRRAIERMLAGDRHTLYAQRILAVIRELDYPFESPATRKAC